MHILRLSLYFVVKLFLLEIKEEKVLTRNIMTHFANKKMWIRVSLSAPDVNSTGNVNNGILSVRKASLNICCFSIDIYLYSGTRLKWSLMDQKHLALLGR